MKKISFEECYVFNKSKDPTAPSVGICFYGVQGIKDIRVINFYLDNEQVVYLKRSLETEIEMLKFTTRWKKRVTFFKKIKRFFELNNVQKEGKNGYRNKCSDNDDRFNS